MTETPESVVQKQLDAYNAHDIDAFMATYSPTITLFNFPSGTMWISGHDAMRQVYEKSFKEKEPHVDIAARIVKGNNVIDHERGHLNSGQSIEGVAIYEVIDGLIQRVWFVED